jgi:hypothetical protein
MDLVAVAQKSLADKAWSSELVLNMGVELLCVANSLPSIPVQDKISLVTQTILKMLDDAEKAGKERLEGSTAIMPTTAQLEECKNLVKILPLILGFVKKGLPGLPGIAVTQCLPRFSWPRLSFACVRKEVVDTVTAVEDMLKHPQEYLEEMRDLVSKVETLLSASKHSLPAAAAPASVVVCVTEPVPSATADTPAPEAAPSASADAPAPEAVPSATADAPAPVPAPLPLPTPELIGEQLPGGLPIQEEETPSL